MAYFTDRLPAKLLYKRFAMHSQATVLHGTCLALGSSALNFVLSSSRVIESATVDLGLVFDSIRIGEAIPLGTSLGS